MANKKPLANYSGEVKELQSGDRIAVSDISDVPSKPTIIHKTSNTTWSSSGVTITGMSFAAEANKKYLIEIFPTGVGSNLTNGSMEFGAPSGASVYESILIDVSYDMYSVVKFYGKNSPYVLGVSISGDDSLRSDYDKCLVVMGGTAGNIVLKSISSSGTLYPCVMVIQEVQ